MSNVHDDYVEGDINTIDDADLDDDLDTIDDDLNTIDDPDPDDDLDDDLDDEVSPGDLAPTARAALAFIATSLADEPSAVEIATSERPGKVVLSLRVNPSDMGRVIGRRGRTAQAIRSLVAAAGARDGVNATVDIVD